MTQKNTLLGLLLILLLLPACKRNSDYVNYHKFANRSWYRYDILKFEIPVTNTEKSYDIYLFARHTLDYPFDNLNFNMVMTTPSGEERIKEYPFTLKRGSQFTDNCKGDSCEATIALKKDIHFGKTGIMVIEIENLVPRLWVPGLLGVGIRMSPHL